MELICELGKRFHLWLEVGTRWQKIPARSPGKEKHVCTVKREKPWHTSQCDDASERNELEARKRTLAFLIS